MVVTGNLGGPEGSILLDFLTVSRFISVLLEAAHDGLLFLPCASHVAFFERLSREWFKAGSHRKPCKRHTLNQYGCYW